MTAPPAMIDFRPRALQGPYTVAPGVTNYTAFTPNGAAVTEADLSSYRFHHHTKVAVYHGRIWVAYSASGTNEDAGGQKTFVSAATDGASPTFGVPLLAVDKQSTFSATGASRTSGDYLTYPRAFVVSGGTLYLVVSLDKTLGANNTLGLALLAVECKSDGTIGAAVRVSSASYTPFSGFSVIGYDSGLGAAIFSAASIFGNWGGSTPNNAASAWVGWAPSFGGNFTEPSTTAMDAGGQDLLRIWRRVSTPDNRLYAQRSRDGGATFGSIFRTALPDAPSSTSIYRLSTGKIAVCGNPQDVTVVRDPLYLATFNAGALSTLYAVRQGLTDVPVYAGSSKDGGASYPGLWEDAGRLLISYSIHKEDVGLSIVPVAGL